MHSTTFSPGYSQSIPQYLNQLLPERDTVIQSLWDSASFLMRFVQDPTATGAISPSSRFLARKITHFASGASQDQPRRILEVGAGTGPFTAEIIKNLKAHDHLDIVELDPSFCANLRKKYAAENVHIHCVPIEAWRPDYAYDTIVSGLPLNAFSPDSVQTILDKLKSLVKDRGHISYFEYLLFPTLKSATLKGHAKADFKKLLQIKEIFFKSFGIKQEAVFLNLPPARVLHFKVTKESHANPLSPISFTS